MLPTDTTSAPSVPHTSAIDATKQYVRPRMRSASECQTQTAYPDGGFGAVVNAVTRIGLSRNAAVRQSEQQLNPGGICVSRAALDQMRDIYYGFPTRRAAR